MIKHTTLALAIVAPVLAILDAPVLPLIVRNPYLSTWLGNARDPPWEHWPIFWTGQEIGFSVMAYYHESRTVYALLGRPQDSLSHSSKFSVSTPIFHGTSLDASTTNLTYGLDNVNITLSFVSPITPASTMRQSLPAAYMAVNLEGSGDVSIYVDVNGQWVSGLRESQITWSLTDTSAHARSGPSIKSWGVARRTEQLLTESSDRSEWGTLRFSGPSHAHHQAGTSALLRQQFAEHGILLNTTDSQFRRIMDEEPVFAFSKTFRLGHLDTSRTRPAGKDHILFTLALVQDPVVQFASSRGLTYMRPLWASYMSNVDAMIEYHYHDFPKALELAGDYSRQLEKDAQQSGPEGYSDIVALSARQVLGATQFSGTPDDPILFLKEISSNGNFQTVDVIFPAFPFFLYTNPKWLAYLLEPLLEHQRSGQYPNDYSMHDLGTHFPNATGHADGRDEYMPVEECGNMLIMALALVNALKTSTSSNHGGLAIQLKLSLDDEGLDTVDDATPFHSKDVAKAWASRSYTLWKQWTGYLVRESLIPRNQLCTDDFAGWLANQTNLALKGIVGIRAMSEIADLVGEDRDAQHYKNISESYMEKWQEYGISRDGTHAKLSYSWYGSWTTIYNLFADALLCFHLPPDSKACQDGPQKTIGNAKRSPFVPKSVYSMQSSWYSAVLQRYGLPLDSRHLYTKSDWQFFAAAVSSQKTRDAIINAVALWVNETVTDRPFTDLYDTEGKGDFSPTRFMARPVVGGHFAPLALRQACGGRAMAGLGFLDQETRLKPDVAKSLSVDAEADGRSTVDVLEEL
jgi:hypothetical protein